MSAGAVARSGLKRDTVARGHILAGTTGLQVVREGGQEPVALGERGAGFLRGLTDEDLHPREGAPRIGLSWAAQVVDRVAGDLRDGLHAQDRHVKALQRIFRAEVVWLGVVRYRVLRGAMFPHRIS